MTEINPSNFHNSSGNEANVKHDTNLKEQRYLYSKNLEQKPDEFISDSEEYKYHPDKLAYEYINSEDGKNFSKLINKIFKSKNKKA